MTEQYRRYARNCLNLSKIYRAPSHSALLVEMAEAWDRLARQAETGADGEQFAQTADYRPMSRSEMQ